MVKNHDKKNADREKIIIFPGRKEEKFQSELGKPNCLVKLSPIKVFCVYVKDLLFFLFLLLPKNMYVYLVCIQNPDDVKCKKVSIIFQKIFTFPSSCFLLGRGRERSISLEHQNNRRRASLKQLLHQNLSTNIF